MFVCTYHSASRLYTEATARMASFSNGQSNCDTLLPDSTFAALDFRNSKKSELCPRQVQWFDYGFKIQNIIKTFRRTARKSVTSYSSEVPVQASIRQKTIRECLITYLKCNKSWNSMILHLHSHFRGSLNNKFLHYRYVSRTIRLDHTMRVCKLLYCTAYHRCWLPPFKVSVTRNLNVEMISTWNKIPSWYHFYIEFLKYSLWRVVGCTFAALLSDAVSEFVCAKSSFGCVTAVGRGF